MKGYKYHKKKQQTNMDQPSLYIVGQNYFSKCFKCGVGKKFFTVYKCGKCDPQTEEKYCYDCCEQSLLNEDDNIAVLCMGCAFCYNYIHISKFYESQKKGGWQRLKFDCSSCTCCCGGNNCLTGSMCCVIEDSEDENKKDENKEKDEKNSDEKPKEDKNKQDK